MNGIKSPLTFYCTFPESDSKSKKQTVRVKMVPVSEQSFIDGTAYTISFTDDEPRTRPNDGGWTQADENKASSELEQELAETKEELQNTIEELETSTEELKASHEETLSTNEELQSSNEELEASSEELRSLNEELSTVNAQLNDQNEQLQNARDDAQNFFASTNIPTLFLDADLRIQRYTPAAELLLKMSPRDIDRELTSLGRDLVDDDLIQDCKDVLRNFQPKRTEVCDYQGRWFLRQVSPYRTEDRYVGGVVLVFQDVSDLKKLSQRAESREAQQAVVAKLGLLALGGSAPEEIMHRAVREVAYVLDVEYCKVLKYQPEQNNLLLIAGVGWQNTIINGQTTVPDDVGSQAGYTLRAQEPVIVDNLAEEKRFSGPRLLIDHGVSSGISCLINHSSPPYGVLGVHTKTARKFTDDDANFLQSVANMLSTAIHTQAAQEKVYRSEERLDMARDAANIGIHDYDVSNDTIYWDDNHRKMWGIPANLEPITFQVFESGLHPDDKKRVTEEVESALQKPGTYEWQFRVLNQQDESIKYIVGKGNVIHRNGKAVRIVGTVQDITARIDLEQSLQHAIKDLRESDQRKNQFLSILGHELRNPLAALTNGVEIVKHQLQGNDRIVGVMKHSVETMSHLLDDLLDLNRVSENRIDLEVESVNLTQLLESVAEQTKTHSEKKQQHLKSDVASHLWVRGDATRLEQIFINLALNSCKYTPKGGEIKIKAYHDNGIIRVDILDTGIGIEASQLDKVFAPFYQIKPETEALQGLGIGLALAKKLVELHEGSIRVESDGLGLGTTFSVSLPAQRRQHTPAAVENDVPPSQQAGRKVLFIDDNVSMLMMMPMLLESLNCTVETAKTGEEGIEKVKSFQPDAIILDIGLPKKSGHQVAEILRDEGYEGVIIALSGYSHKEARDKSKQAGIDYHLSKPSSLKEISDLLTAGRETDT